MECQGVSQILRLRVAPAQNDIPSPFLFKLNHYRFVSYLDFPPEISVILS